MKTLARTKFQTITGRQWNRLRPLVEEAGAVLETAQLRSATGMTVDDAAVLLQALHRERLAALFIQVFHDCAEHPVAVFPFQRTIEALSRPWTCPECEETVTDPTGLQFEQRAVLTDALILVEDDPIRVEPVPGEPGAYRKVAEHRDREMTADEFVAAVRRLDQKPSKEN